MRAWAIYPARHVIYIFQIWAQQRPWQPRQKGNHVCPRPPTPSKYAAVWSNNPAAVWIASSARLHMCTSSVDRSSSGNATTAAGSSSPASIVACAHADAAFASCRVPHGAVASRSVAVQSVRSGHTRTGAVAATSVVSWSVQSSERSDILLNKHGYS